MTPREEFVDALTRGDRQSAFRVVDQRLASGDSLQDIYLDVVQPSMRAEDKRHQIGLRMLCDLLELDGWDTLYVGASVPVESLVPLVQKFQPEAVALSATIAPHVPRVRAAITAIRAAELARQPVIAVGGRAFHSDPALARRIGADVTANYAREAVRMLDALVREGHAA